jgi:dihydrofolate reductase
LRKLIYAINCSVDGFCNHVLFGGSQEVLEYHTEVVRDSGLFVYGRKTYALMVPYWPDVARNPASKGASLEFAKAFNAVPKVVFSRTLDPGAAENGARIVGSELRDAVLQLKRQPGKNILTGGVALPAQLTELGLVDQWNIVIHPLLAGQGRRLLEGLRLGGDLKRIGTRMFASGSVLIQYAKT